jgi:3-deoxy-D-manno-octulosonic-acid transferase
MGVFWTPSGSGKVRRSLAARRGSIERLAAWGRAHRDAARPLAWMHPASVGEGLMARPVIARLRAHHPDVQVAYTFFSPSAERFARDIGADVVDYLPFDTPHAARELLATLRPALLAFSKLDVWPVLAEAAAAHGVPVALISATLDTQSRRTSRLARAVLGDAYAALAAVGAVDAATVERLRTLGVRPERAVVTGDTRYDQVWERVQAGTNGNTVSRMRSNRPTLVAGSTWPSDEDVLLPAWDLVASRVPGARLIIAAHEPSEAWRAAITRAAEARGRRAATIDAATADTDVVVIDRMGVLADLYAAGNVAYVGGGFHAAGLHSVVEPAAHGVPVVVGPRAGASRDASALLTAGGGIAAGSITALADALTRWLADGDAAAAAGARAREVVRRELGATDRTTALLTRLLRR